MAVSKTSLISYWKMDEASGNRADSHGGNTLTDNNTVTAQTGKLNSAGQFTRANSEFLSLASNASIQTGDIDFTLTGWVYLDTEPAEDISAIHKSGEYNIGRKNSSDRLRFLYGSAEVLANNLGNVATSTWYFVVCWHDATANTINIQVNNGTADSAADGTPPAANGNAFAMGAETGGGAGIWDGRIDEVGFWKRVLTASERTELYGAGTPPSYDTFVGDNGLDLTSKMW